ncbi:MAG: PH domain-containing protein [Candidatus Daviesbacteria bacterium]|nr:PH domain-containing protein [Candidatus Daviesbacteria bacterium]
MAKLHYTDSPTEKEKKSFSPFLSEDEELILATGFGVAYVRSIFVMALFWPGLLFGAMVFSGTYWAAKLDLLLTVILGLTITCLFAYLRSMHVYNSNRYLLTTRRVIVKKGVFAVKLASALYDKITHIEVDQTFVDRMLMHHGTIIVHTAGSQKDELVLKFVDYPIEMKNLLERLINREREQYGMRATPLVAVEGELVQ